MIFATQAAEVIYLKRKGIGEKTNSSEARSAKVPGAKSLTSNWRAGNYGYARGQTNKPPTLIAFL